MTNNLWDAFDRFHAANPHVYDLFDKYTKELIHAGHRKFSADAIIQRIRWDGAVQTNGDTYKINNNIRAGYPRLWMENNPEHQGFFETRDRH